MIRGRASLTALLAALLAAPAGGCAAREEKSVDRPDFETRLELKNAAGEAAREFRSGETITFVVTIRNRSAAPRTLTLPTSQTHDCIVTSADHREVWRLSSGRMYAQMITEWTLKPGETRSFATPWDPLDVSGRPLPGGEYEAVGLVPARAPGCRSDKVRFTIRAPSPASAAR